MNYEEEIALLKRRIEILEKTENKRIAKRRRENIFKLIKFILVISIISFVCGYFYINYVRPYKEKIDKVNEKVDQIEEFVDDKLDFLQNLNPFL